MTSTQGTARDWQQQLAHDVALVVAWRETGDRSALETLFAPHLETAYRVAAAVLRSGEAATDAVQDACVKAMAGLPGWRPVRPFSAWFLTIVHRTAADVARRSARHATRTMRLSSGDGETALGPQPPEEALDVLREILAGLTPTHALAVVLVHGEGRSVGDLARVLGIPECTVRTRLQRTLKRLAGSLRRRGFATTPPLLATWLSIQPARALPIRLPPPPLRSAPQVQLPALVSWLAAAVTSAALILVTTAWSRAGHPATASAATTSAHETAPPQAPTARAPMSEVLALPIHFSCTATALDRLLARLGEHIGRGYGISWACARGPGAATSWPNDITLEADGTALSQVLDVIAAREHLHWVTAGRLIVLLPAGSDLATTLAGTRRDLLDQIAQTPHPDANGQNAYFSWLNAMNQYQPGMEHVVSQRQAATPVVPLVMALVGDPKLTAGIDRVLATTTDRDRWRFAADVHLCLESTDDGVLISPMLDACISPAAGGAPSRERRAAVRALIHRLSRPHGEVYRPLLLMMLRAGERIGPPQSSGRYRDFLDCLQVPEAATAAELDVAVRRCANDVHQSPLMRAIACQQLGLIADQTSEDTLAALSPLPFQRDFFFAHTAQQVLRETAYTSLVLCRILRQSAPAATWIPMYGVSPDAEFFIAAAGGEDLDRCFQSLVDAASTPDRFRPLTRATAHAFIQALDAQVRSASSIRAAGAAVVLVDNDDPLARRELTAAWRDASAQRRSVLAPYLIGSCWPMVLPSLRAMTDADLGSAFAAMLTMGYPSNVPRVETAIGWVNSVAGDRKRSLEVRLQAVRILATVGPSPLALAQLTIIALDQQEPVRLRGQALLAIGYAQRMIRSDPRGAAARLITARERFVRLAAYFVLSEERIDSATAARVRQQLAVEQDPLLIRREMGALFHGEDPEEVAAILPFLSDDRPSVRFFAATTLGLFRCQQNPAMTPAVLATLTGRLAVETQPSVKTELTTVLSTGESFIHIFEPQCDADGQLIEPPPETPCGDG